MLVLVTGGAVQQGLPPESARRTDTAEWVMGLARAPVELREACGWFDVIETPAPALASNDVSTRTIELVGGRPTVVWVVRPKTLNELDADAAAIAATTERLQARNAIAALDTFLALATPTIAQVTAVVQLLCRVERRLIRDAFGG